MTLSIATKIVVIPSTAGAVGHSGAVAKGRHRSCGKVVGLTAVLVTGDVAAVSNRSCSVDGSLTVPRSFQERAFVIQVISVKIGKRHQTVVIIKRHLAELESHQPIFAQFAQDTVDVYRAEAKAVGKHVLRQRALVPGLRRLPYQFQPHAQFQQEMRHALLGIPSAEVDKVFNHHRLVAGGSPQHSRRKAWCRFERLEKITSLDFGGLNRGDRFDVVISGAEQHRAQPQKIARNLEIDDLPRAIGQQLVRADPARSQNVGATLGLAFVDDVLARRKSLPSAVQLVKHRQLLVRQSYKCSELAGEGGVQC